jgi:hypothetical protein
MPSARPFLASVLLTVALLTAACSDDGREVALSEAPGSTVAPRRAPTTVEADATAAAPPVVEAATTTTPPSPTTTSTAPPAPAAPALLTAPRVVQEQPWVSFATTGGLTLHHPASRVERIGFHESNHDGAQDLVPSASAVQPVVLETRERGTGARTAADVVVEPGVEIRSPVTGTVIRGGGYILYCEHDDHYVVIEPDDHPGWEVKVLHMDSLHVGRGEHVTAGETVLASGPNVLPFESQVDEVRTTDPAWPHIHIEVVDPSIPDRPSPGGGCS